MRVRPEQPGADAWNPEPIPNEFEQPGQPWGCAGGFGVARIAERRAECMAI